MGDILSKIFDFDKISAKLVLLIWIASGILLFAPEYILTKLKLIQFIVAHGTYIGVTFLLSTGFLIVTIYSTIANRMQLNRFVKGRKKKIIDSLNRLDEHEKSNLREFLIKGGFSIEMPFGNPTVVGLLNKGILIQASSTGLVYLHGSYFTYNISDIAYDELLKNTHLIGWPTFTEGMTKEMQDDIIKRRPRWAIEKDQFERNTF